MIRKGMFVKNIDGRIGIVADDGFGLIVHVIDANGNTKRKLATNPDTGETAVVDDTDAWLDNWQQAAIADIPASRRGEPGLLEQLGYR